MKFNISEIRIPKVKMPEHGIPKISIPKLHRKAGQPEPAEDEISESAGSETCADDILGRSEAAGTQEPEQDSSPRPQEKVKSYGMVISEDQLRMVWAAEIGFSLLAVFASVLIAIAS